MKSLLKQIVLSVLQFFAKIKLKRMNAKIIGVTGSVGKTTCKEIIYNVLSKRYKVLRNIKSYNTEFGLLLTILHQESGFSSPWEWIKILIKSFFRTLFVSDKYDYLVLEMGVDKPGDMDFLTKITPPDFALITAIKPVHLDTGQFANIEAIFNEKRKIFDKMAHNGIAIINMDDERIAKIARQQNEFKSITYGFSQNTEIKADSFNQTEKGITFSVHYKNNEYHYKAHLFGKYHISILLPAIIIGLLTDVPLKDIQNSIKEFSLPPGRMSLIEGKNDTLILDSSYNASPEAVIESLKVLNFFGKERLSRRVFVFGNMNELGEYSKDLHMKVGEKIPESADILITVGDDVRYAASSANKNGMQSENISSFKTAKEAANFYKKIIKKGDIILVKGSQNNVFLEIFVKELMLHPEEAKEKLVRQDEKWKNIKP